MRWLIAAWAFLQTSIDTDYYPDGARAGAYGLVAVLVLGNLVVMAGAGRARTDRDAWRVGLIASVFDVLVGAGFVALYAFDSDRSVWAVLFLVPMAAAARFQVRGALGSLAGVIVLYVLVQFGAEAAYGHPVVVSSVTFRMGLVLLVGLFAGRMARQLHEQKTELAGALARLEQVDEWRSRLVQMLAHDVRSPLGQIDGTTQLLLHRLGQMEPAQTRPLLEAIQRQSARLQRLSADLLDLARSENDSLELAKEAFDLQAAIREVTPLIAAADGEVTFGSDRPVPVVADRQRIEQVYANLVGNALRHGEPPVQVSVCRTGDTVELAVTDAGSGVPPEQEADLFRAFGKSDQEDSVGLGLWVARTLVEAHGGTIGYERDRAAGLTTFRVRLPAGDDGR